MRPARSITFYFCVAEQSSGRLDTERERKKELEHRSWNTGYLSRFSFQNNFFSTGGSGVYSSGACVRFDTPRFLLSRRLVEISPLTLVLVTLSPFRVSKLATINHDDEPGSNLFTGFSNCETPTVLSPTTDSSNTVISGAWPAIARCHARNDAPRRGNDRPRVNHTAFSDPRVPNFPSPLVFRAFLTFRFRRDSRRKRTKADSSRTSCDQEEDRKVR